MTLPEVMAEVLGDRSMTQTELMVAMLEAGYQTQMDKRALRDRVGVMLRENKGRFNCQGRNWSYRD